MPKAILFDVDNTLYSETNAHAIAFAKVTDYVQQHLGIGPDTWAVLYKEEMAKMKALLGLNAAIHNRMIRILRILEDRKLPLYHAKVLNDLYWEALVEAAQPEEGVKEALTALKKAGYRLGIGTNMTLDWQMVKLQKLELLDLFDFIVSSEEAGTEKPAPAFFRFCAQRAGLSPKDCLFIGDSLEGDVFGAENAGMQALWYAPDTADFSRHAGFSRYCQLQNLIPMV